MNVCSSSNLSRSACCFCNASISVTWRHEKFKLKWRQYTSTFSFHDIYYFLQIRHFHHIYTGAQTHMNHIPHNKPIYVTDIKRKTVIEVIHPHQWQAVHRKINPSTKRSIVRIFSHLQTSLGSKQLGDNTNKNEKYIRLVYYKSPFIKWAFLDRQSKIASH